MSRKQVLVLVLIFALILPTGIVTAKGGGGGGSAEADIPETGELYGDLYVISRDLNGVPILDQHGCVQPIAEDGTVLTLYTNIGEDIYCEVTEDLALLVQTVDFGRLNEGRAPDAVIQHAFDEAINSINKATEMKLDPAGRIMLYIDEAWKTIDSPLENLALYMKLMKEGHWVTLDVTPITRGGRPGTKGPPEGDGPDSEDRPVLSESAIALLGTIGYANLGNPNNQLNNKDLELAASLLAAGGDKGGNVTLDMVMYVNSIYGINQLGTLPGEIDDKTYFDFSEFRYGLNDGNALGREFVYAQRGSSECDEGSVYVLVTAGEKLWEESCSGILDSVLHFQGNEIENVRGFVQAVDDALQVIEFIHNFRVPEELPVLP